MLVALVHADVHVREYAVPVDWHFKDSNLPGISAQRNCSDTSHYHLHKLFRIERSGNGPGSFGSNLFADYLAIRVVILPSSAAGWL